MYAIHWGIAKKKQFDMES